MMIRTSINTSVTRCEETSRPLLRQPSFERDIRSVRCLDGQGYAADAGCDHLTSTPTSWIVVGKAKSRVGRNILENVARCARNMILRPEGQASVLESRRSFGRGQKQKQRQRDEGCEHGG